MIHQPLYTLLIQAAQDKRQVFYKDVAELLNFVLDRDADRAEMGRVLDAISRYSHELGHPLLSVLVVNQDTGAPSGGFFTMAREVGRYSGHTEMDRLTFSAKETQAVFDFWAQQVDETHE